MGLHGLLDKNTGFQDTYWSTPNKKLMRFLSNMLGPMVRQAGHGNTSIRHANLGLGRE
jgi:hypothetical protein